MQLVLIKLLNGTSTQSMRVQNSSSGGTDSFHYPEEYRLEVLARAIEGYARQLASGLNQADFAGRNFLLVTPGLLLTRMRPLRLSAGSPCPGLISLITITHRLQLPPQIRP